MKKKTLVLFSSIIGLLFVSIFLYGSSLPQYGDTHSEAFCHQNTAGYTISTNVSSPISASGSTTINFSITASGSNLFIQAHPNAEDNAAFIILPTTARINDNGLYDNDLTGDMMVVNFSVTTPSINDYYVIFIIAGDNSTNPPPFAFLEIGISIGGVAPPGFDFSNLFDHLGLYLGLPALLLVTLGTILVLVNENKFVKLHGFLAGGSLILTIINLIAGLTKIPVSTWFGVYPLAYHIPHIALGTIGLVSGFFSMLFGIAAERKPAKLTGYITLVSWWAAFFVGYFLNNNLLLI
ncbi:MAG: hypothetical protein ACFFDB_07855 [Promethearchaeota archaeon]